MAKVPDFIYEKSLLPRNCRYLLGIDEVGRGPIAGPLAVGAFLIDISNFDLDLFIKLSVRDSKLLSSKTRQKILNTFESNNYSYKVKFTQSSEIDKIGIHQSIISSIESLASDFRGHFDFILIDGNLKVKSLADYRSVVKADRDCFSVASASVCAKVLRDNKMDKLHQAYPQYDFIHNKGYGTAKHLNAIKKHGPCPQHRFSYQPLKSFSSV